MQERYHFWEASAVWGSSTSMSGKKVAPSSTFNESKTDNYVLQIVNICCRPKLTIRMKREKWHRFGKNENHFFRTELSDAMNSTPLLDFMP